MDFFPVAPARGLTPTWSYSKLMNFESCPQRIKLAYVDKAPQPPEDPTSPLARGSRIHLEAENYVLGKLAELPKSLSKFAEAFTDLRAKFEAHPDHFAIEENWGVDEDWAPTEWDAENIWGRIKLDACVYISPDVRLVIDYKTGKSKDKGVAHTQQAQVYALATFMRNPNVQQVDVEFWYLDEGKTMKRTYYRNRDLPSLLKNWTTRAKKLTTAVVFPPKPSRFTCAWCPFGLKGTSACPFAV